MAKPQYSDYKKTNYLILFEINGLYKCKHGKNKIFNDIYVNILFCYFVSFKILSKTDN